MARESAGLAAEVVEPLIVDAPERRRDYAGMMLRKIKGAAEASQLGAAGVSLWQDGRGLLRLEDLGMSYIQAKRGANHAIDWTLKVRRKMKMMRMFDDAKMYITASENQLVGRVEAAPAGAIGTAVASRTEWALLESCLDVAWDALDLVRVGAFHRQLADRVSQGERHTAQEWSRFVRSALLGVCGEKEWGEVMARKPFTEGKRHHD